jgi:NMD protein affecting ribosome stability and mRNA decay
MNQQDEVDKVDAIVCYQCDAEADIEHDMNKDYSVNYCPFCGTNLDPDDREDDFVEELETQIAEFEDESSDH